MKVYKLLAINLGSTSSKLAYYENKDCKVKTTVEHPAAELAVFNDVMEQADYRQQAVEKFLSANRINLDSLDAIVSRGGQTQPLEGGIYQINETMVSQAASGMYGRHATNIGSGLAYRLAQGRQAIPMVVDPPVTDEFSEVARLSGHPELPRVSCFHALSQRATGKRYASDHGKNYSELNLIITHMGGGISVAAHCQGRMIDANNALDGDGPYCTSRTGSLPVGALVDLCFSGRYSHRQARNLVNGQGGLLAYLQESDVRSVAAKATENAYYALCLEGMVYQTCKEIGAMATVLGGIVDAIVITGGIANSAEIVSKIKQQVGFIAPIEVYPGENEMDALVFGALEGLQGTEPVKSL